jgi:hypothetical protein
MDPNESSSQQHCANPIRMESPRSVGFDFEYRNLHFKV